MWQNQGREVALEAGAGRPFRFALQLDAARGRLVTWMGTPWAFGFGGMVVVVFAALGGALGVLLGTGDEGPGFLALVAAASGALVMAFHLRPRTVVFERREGTWGWRERWSVQRGRWVAITDEKPLRLEREILPTAEGFGLYAGSLRLLSYLGDPVIGRRLTRSFRTAGVPLRTVLKRDDV